MAAIQLRASAELDDELDEPAATVSFVFDCGALQVHCDLGRLWLAKDSAATSRALLAFLEGRANQYLADTKDYVCFTRADGSVCFKVGGEDLCEGEVTSLTTITVPEADCAAGFAALARDLRALGLADGLGGRKPKPRAAGHGTPRSRA